MTPSQLPAAPSSKAPWNHMGLVVFSPAFDRPFRPVAAFIALNKRWVTLIRNALFLLLAVVAYQWLIPPLSEMVTLSWNWVLPLVIRNLILMLLVAGSLHYYLFIRRAQGSKTKFDAREQMDRSRIFTFGDQVWDNMFLSLGSGVTIWSVYEVLYWWGAANLLIPVLDFVNHPLAILVWLPVFPLLIASHFFLIHRLLHWPPLFKSVHKLHHRHFECNYGNVDVPWDQWINAVHDGSDEGTALAQARRRKMYQVR